MIKVTKQIRYDIYYDNYSLTKSFAKFSYHRNFNFMTDNWIHIVNQLKDDQIKEKEDKL